MSSSYTSYREIGLTVLPRLPTLIVQAGDIGVVLVGLGDPGGWIGLHDLDLTGRRIVIKCRGRWRGRRPGRTAREGESHEEPQQTGPVPSSCGMSIVYHISLLS